MFGFLCPHLFSLSLSLFVLFFFPARVPMFGEQRTIGLEMSRLAQSHLVWRLMNTTLFRWHLRRLSLADHRILGSFGAWNARILGSAGPRVYAALGYEMFSGGQSFLLFFLLLKPFSPAGGARPRGAPGAFVHLLHVCLGGRDGGLWGFEGQIYLEALFSLTLVHQVRYVASRTTQWHWSVGPPQGGPG